jgi:two-component system, NtrC family, response regulator HydG
MGGEAAPIHTCQLTGGAAGNETFLPCGQYTANMESPSRKNSALFAALADTAEQICAADDLAGIAAASVRCLAGLFSCSSVSFSAFDLTTFQLILDEHLPDSGCARLVTRLERSGDLAASLKAGAEVLTVVDDRPDEYFVIYEPHPEMLPQRCELRIPFFMEPHCLCVLNLGKKESGTDYSSNEIDALRILVTLLGKCGICPSPSESAEPPPRAAKELAPYQRRESYSQFLGCSPAILRIKRAIGQIAPTQASVLITGESGTGKELVARAIHQQSCHACRDMVIVNCAALPEQLVESELFGHERGAFTGALVQKRGKFEFADNSTLFLDEIGDLTLPVQAKLLRFLQDGVFQRVGGNQNLRSQVRLISATNKNLARAIVDGTFREDLYYRINVVQIEIPPLRERREDILLLTDHYARHFARKYLKEQALLHPEIKAWFQEYSFPGNVRELMNIVERVVILGNDAAALETLPRHLPIFPPHVLSSSLSLDDLEKEHIQTILKNTCNNKSAAARILGIARKTLRERMAKYGIA